TTADPATRIRRHHYAQAPELVQQGARRHWRRFLGALALAVPADRLREATEPAKARKRMLCHSRHAPCARVVARVVQGLLPRFAASFFAVQGLQGLALPYTRSKKENP